MALLFMDSFDGYGGTSSHMIKWWQQPNLRNSSPTARTGTYYIYGDARRDITPGAGFVIVGFAYYHMAGQSMGVTLTETASSSALSQVSLVLDTDNKVRIRSTHTGGTLLDTSTSTPLVATSWNFIEWKCLVATSGSWTVKINGVIVLNGTGNTQPRSTSNVRSLLFAGSTVNGIDDLYVLDSTGSSNNDFIDDCKVERISPQTGNGSNVGLTCSTGTDHGALVDELPANDDTDYNYGTTIGVKDTYNFTDVTSTGVVKAVQTSVRMRKTDSATKQAVIVARVGSDYDGSTTQTLATNYSQYQQIWETRPSDGSAWTISDVNAAEFGLKITT